MDGILIQDVFVEKAHAAKRPFSAVLLSGKGFNGYPFKRSLVTPFRKVWEILAVAVANEGLGYATFGHRIRGTVKEGRLRRIEEVLNCLAHPDWASARRWPDWTGELRYILAGRGNNIPVEVECDIYVEARRTDNKRYAFELKAPLPNSDITRVSKAKIFKLYSMEPPQIDGAYFALPYNPYGRKEAYAWSFPARWFDMREDPVVLIGDEFWEKIGGPGTCRAFIDAVNELGEECKQHIYSEYLGIEPPETLIAHRGLNFPDGSSV